MNEQLPMHKVTTLEEVRKCGFKPEPHTVSFKDDGEWHVLTMGDDIVCTVCITDKHGGKYFSEVYTVPEYRGRGLCTFLITFVADVLYPNHRCIAHCLESSVHCFERAGFKEVGYRKFKHGDQHVMQKEAE